MDAVAPTDPRPRGDVEQRLVGSARRLFIEHGYASTSTDAICLAARASKESLARYFGGKEGLFAAVVEEMIAASAADLAAQQGKRRSSLERDVADYVAQLVDRLMGPEFLGLLRLVAAEQPRQPQLGELLRTTMAERTFREATVILEAHRPTSVIDRHTWARLLVGGVLSYVVMDGLLAGQEAKRPSRGRLNRLAAMCVAAVDAAEDQDDPG